VAGCRNRYFRIMVSLFWFRVKMGVSGVDLLWLHPREFVGEAQTGIYQQGAGWANPKNGPFYHVSGQPIQGG